MFDAIKAKAQSFVASTKSAASSDKAKTVLVVGGIAVLATAYVATASVLQSYTNDLGHAIRDSM